MFIRGKIVDFERWVQINIDFCWSMNINFSKKSEETDFLIQFKNEKILNS